MSRACRPGRWFLSCLMLVLNVRCPARAPAASDAELAVDRLAAEAQLRACPRGDALWRSALSRATDDADLARWIALAQEVTAAHPERWEPHWAVGDGQFRRSQLALAKPALATALGLAENEHDPVGIACAANRLGFIAYYEGALEQARAFYDRALASAQQAQRRDLMAFIQNNRAGLLKETGDLAAAVAALGEATQLLAQLGLDKPARDAAYNEIVLRLELSDLAGAEAGLDSLQRTAEQAADGENVALCALLRGELARARGQLAAAREWFGRVGSSSPQAAISAALGLGRVALAQRDFVAAQQQFATAAALARDHQIAIDALLADVFAAQAELAAGRWTEAERRARVTLRAAEQAGSQQFVAWLAHATLGRIAKAQGRVALALREFEQAAALLEGQGQQLDPLGAGLHFLFERSDPFSDWAVLLARQAERGDHTAAARAFAVVERAHARALRRLVAGHRTSAAPATLQQVQSALRPGELLLDYLFGAEHGVIIAISHERVISATTQGTQALIPAVLGFRVALQRPLSSLPARHDPRSDLLRDDAAAQQLRRIALDPVAAAVQRARRLLIVADRELALVPFAALPTDAAWSSFLGDTHEVALMPLAGAPNRGAARTPVLLAGDPIADRAAGIESLPRAAEELTAVARLWPAADTTMVRAEEFTATRLVAQLDKRFGTIHLASHAEASTLDPRRCAILLSHGERLGFDKIATLSLRDALVVLSACRTGEGEAVPGEGIVGLGWAFFAAGAEGLVVSQWSVPDSDAAALMTLFHRRLAAGDDPITALTSAQRARRAEKWHPVFWAPFVVEIGSAD